MNDFASLGLVIDATQVDQGVKSLDNLTAASARTEAAAGKNANAWVTNMQGVAASMKTAEAQTSSLSDATAKLIDKYDPLGAKLRSLQEDYATLRKGLSTVPVDKISDSSLSALSSLEGQITKTSKAIAEFGTTGYEMGMHGAKGFEGMAEAAGKGRFATAGVTREFIVLGHEVMTGNFSRIPGSMMVMAERTGNLGGIVEAVMNPMALTFIAVGAAAIAMGADLVKMSNGIDNFNKSMALTNNYAGQTRDSISSMAVGIQSSITGGVGKANEMLAGLAATGHFTGGELSAVGQAALTFAALTGESSKDVIKQFDGMTSGVAKWAEESNKSYHFLTVAQYEEIAMLERQGQSQLAIMKTMDALNASLDKHALHVGPLTAIWKGWGLIIDEVNGSMRKLVFPTIGEQAQKAIAELASLQKEAKAAEASLGAGPAIKADYDKRIAEQRAKVHDLIAASNQDEIAAGKKQHDDMLAQSAIAAKNEYDLLKQSLKTREQLNQDDIKKYEDGQKILAAAGSASVDDAIKHAETVAAIKARGATAADDASHKQLEGMLKGFQDEAAATVKHYQEMDKLAEVNHKAGLLTDAQFYNTKQKDLDAEYAAQVASYNKQIDALADYTSRSAKEEQDTQNKLDDTYSKRDKLEQDHTDKVTILTAQAAATQKASFDALVDDMQKSSDKEIDHLQAMLTKEKQHGLEIGLTRDQIDKLRESQDALYTSHLADSIVWTQSLIDSGDLTKDNLTLEEARLEQLKKELALRQQVAETLASNAVAEADESAAKKAQEVWKHTATTIENDLYNAILDGGGKGFKKLLKDMELAFAKQILQIPVQYVSGSLASMFTGTSPTASTMMSTFGGQGGGILGAASNGMSLYQGASNLAALTGIGQLGAGASLTGGVSTLASGATAFSDAAFTASQAAASTGLMSGITGAIAAVPGWGWALAGAALLANSMNGGETRQGGQYGYDFAGQTLFNNRRGTAVSGATSGVNFLEGPSGGEINGANVRTAITDTVSGINDMLKQLGSSASLVGFQAALESSGEGRGGVFAGGTLSTGTTFGQSGKGDNYAGTLFDKAFSNSPDSAQALKDFSTELKQTTLQALQAATDIPKSIAEQLTKVDVKSLTDDAATKLLTSITTEITGVNQLRDALGTLPTAFDNLKNLSFDAADGLIKAAGSLQNLQSGISYFVQNFYTDGERTAAVADDVNKRLAALGYTGITTDAQFRAIATGLDLTTDAGQKTEAALLALAPEFKQVSDAATKAAQDAAAAQKQAADAAAQAQQQYQQQYQQSVDAARSAVSDAYNRESSALQNTITQFHNFATALRDFNQSLLTSNLSTLSPGSQYQTLKDQFDQTYSLAKSGDPVAVGKMQSVAQQFLEASKSYNASSTAYANDFAYVRTALEATAQTSDAQANIAQQQLSEMQRQVTGIIDVNNSVMSLADAIKQFMGISASGAGGSMGAAGIGPMSVFGGGLGDVDEATKLKMVQGWYAANSNANKNPTQGDLAYWTNKLVSGVGADDVQTLFNKVVAQNTGTAYNPYDALVGTTVDQSKIAMLRQQYSAGLIDEHGNPIQHFASGGYFGGGMRLVGERGPELEITGPSRIFNADQTRGLLSGAGNQEVADLLKQVLAELRASTVQRGAVGTAQLQKLDRVTEALGGNKRMLAKATATATTK